MNSRYKIKYKNPDIGTTRLIHTKYNVEFECLNHNLKKPNPYWLYIRLPITDMSINKHNIFIEYVLNSKTYITSNPYELGDLNKINYLKIYIKNKFTTGFSAIITKKIYTDDLELDSFSTIFIGQKDKLEQGQEYLWIHELKHIYMCHSPNHYATELRIEKLSKFNSIINKIYNKYSVMISEVNEKIKLA